MESRDCRTVRDRLTRSERGGETAAAHRAHVKTCAECAAFARRLALAREVLRQPAAPAAAMEPDASFALRVVERLPRPAELLGWAALRALPAAVALVLALLWIGVSQPPSAQEFREVLSESASPDIVLTYAAVAPQAGP
jgi:predicted anti-sigma-YlaC factor YlaD